MVEAKKITIFRLDANSTSAAIDTGDEIIFNDSTKKNTNVESAFITTIQKLDIEGIGNNQTAEQTDGNKQPLGVVDGTYTITGFISKLDGNSDNGTNAFLTKLQTWKDGAQVIEDDWESGVFGIEDLNDSSNTLLPIKDTPGAPALIFVSYQKTNNYQSNRADFVLTFRRSRSITV